MPRAANLCSSTAAERCSRSSAPSHTSAPSRRRVWAWSSVSRSRLWHGAGSGASSRIPPAFSGTPEASACSSAQSTSDCSSTRRANCRDAECLRLGWRASGEDFPRTRVREEKAGCGGVLDPRGASRRNRAAGAPGCSTSAIVGPAAGRFPRTIPRKLVGKRLSIDAQQLRRTPLVPADSLEDPEDVAPIDLLERRQVAGLAGGEGGTLATPGTDVLRQVLYANLLAHGERHRPLDTVLQLADVAGPRVIKQALGRCAGETAHPLAGVLTIPLHEVLGEQQHVRATRPERWQLDLDDGHAEEEVLPEPALVNRRPQFLVRVGDENQELRAAVDQRRFREDLFFRVAVIQIELPPLRARGADVLLLAQHFVERYGKHAGKRVRSLSRAAAERLLDYPWPGNVRELQNCIERAVALTMREEIGVEDLPEHVRAWRRKRPALAVGEPGDLVPLEEVDRRHILRVFEAVGRNQRRAAQLLGIDRKTLGGKLARYGARERSRHRAHGHRR